MGSSAPDCSGEVLPAGVHARWVSLAARHRRGLGLPGVTPVCGADEGAGEGALEGLDGTGTVRPSSRSAGSIISAGSARSLRVYVRVTSTDASTKPTACSRST